MKKVAVVGFGFMGITHAVSILRNPDLCLKAIVDIFPDLIGEKLRSGIGNIVTGNIDHSAIEVINKYKSLSDCLSSEDIDAVNICTHANLHYEMTKTALTAGKHVFLEKPFCIDPLQAEELVILAEKMKKKLMIGHVVRFMPPYRQLKNWIDSKEFGEIKFLSFSRFCGLPSWGQWKDKNVRELSGGALFDLAIHDIDFAQYAVGVPSEVKSNCLPGEYSPYDYISAMWNFPGKDLHVKIEGGFTFHSSFPFQASFMGRFENASIHFSSLRGDVIQIAGNNEVKEIPAGDGTDGYYNEIAYFADCLKNDLDPLECMPGSSLESIKLCYNHF
jgi:predicted dehydrogenase